MWLKENKDNLRTIICKILVAKRNKTWLKWKLNTHVLAATPNRPVLRRGREQMWWARACAMSHKSWRHVRLKLPSPRKRLPLKFPTTSFSKNVVVAWTSYQMSEVSALCNRGGGVEGGGEGSTSLSNDNSANFSGEKKYNEELRGV